MFRTSRRKYRFHIQNHIYPKEDHICPMQCRSRRHKHQKNYIEFVTSDDSFFNGDKERIRNKWIIKDILHGNYQTYKERITFWKEKMATWCERDHGLIATMTDKFHKKKKQSYDVPGEFNLPISSLLESLHLLCYFVAALHFPYVSFALDFF